MADDIYLECNRNTLFSFLLVVSSTSRHERNSNTTISTKRIITIKVIFEFCFFSKILRLRVMCLTLLSTINISVWYRDGQLYRCMTHEYSYKTNKAQVNDGNRTHSLSSDIVTYFLLHSKQIYTNIYIIFQEYIEILKAISLAFLLYFYKVRFRVMVFNATVNSISTISWRSVLFVEETGVTGENDRPVASHQS
jgi:hypothetical protein